MKTLLALLPLFLLACHECPTDPSLMTKAEWEREAGCRVRSTYTFCTSVDQCYSSLTLYRDTTFEVPQVVFDRYKKNDLYDPCLSWEPKALVLHKISEGR